MFSLNTIKYLQDKQMSFYSVLFSPNKINFTTVSCCQLSGDDIFFQSFWRLSETPEAPCLPSLFLDAQQGGSYHSRGKYTEKTVSTLYLTAVLACSLILAIHSLVLKTRSGLCYFPSKVWTQRINRSGEGRAMKKNWLGECLLISHEH